MTYRAKMKDGQVVFEGGIKPADGVELRVDVVESPAGKDNGAASSASDGATVGQRLMKYAGTMPTDGLPSDGSRNLDHYIYGTPKDE